MIVLSIFMALPLHAAPATPGDAYCTEVLDGISRIVPLLPLYARQAEPVAARMIAGGTLWLAGDRGFVLEALNRAGGLMACKWLKKATDVKAGDVVSYGLIRQAQPADLQFLDEVGRAGAHWMAFAPGAKPTGLGLPVPAPPAADPNRLPSVSPVLAAATWTFMAELVSALTRQGKLPPMYQSVLVPGGRERNAEHLKLTWEPTTPQPIPPLILGRTYLARVSNSLRRLRATQADEFPQAGRMAAEAIRSGHTAWYASLGHLPPELPGQPGDPGVLKPLKMSTPDKLGDFVKAGDVILYVGYYEPYGPWVEKAHGLRARIVTVVSGTPERRAEDMGADLNINACWPYGDAVLDLPGHDIKVLPPSGVVAATAYFMLVAETAAALR
jgi:hypothetical protein